MKRRVPAKVQFGRFLRTVLPAALIFLAAALVFFGILTYRITHPGAVAESVSPSLYLLPSQDITWTSKDGSEIAGWWIPGLKGAPGVLMAPGYGTGKADALSLAAALHALGFNVLIYDERGSGAQPRGAGSLGLRETEDMLAGLDVLRRRSGVNGGHIGIWGVDVGAHAALKAAASRSEVRAVAADSAYDTAADFHALRLRDEMGLDNAVLESGCRGMFMAYQRVSPFALTDGIPLESLSDRSILFIQGENRRDLARQTEQLYDRIQPQKEMISLPISRVRVMTGEALASYDRQVSNFFHLNLPIEDGR